MGDRWLGLPATVVVTALAMLAVAPDGWLAHAVPLLLAGSGSALAFLRAGSVPAPQRMPWRLYGAGGLTAVISGAAGVVVDPATSTAASVAAVQVADSLVMLWFIAGTFWLVRLRAPGRHREVLLDGFALSLPPIVLAWELAAQPALLVGASRVAAADALIMLTLSVVMIWLSGALVRLGSSCPSAYLVAASAVAFTVYSVIDVAGLGAGPTAQGSDLATLVNAAGGGLAVLAAVHPSARQLTDGGTPQRPSMTGRQLAMLAACLAVPPLGLLLGALGRGDRTFYAVTTLEVLLLAGPRAVDVLRERDAALRRRDVAQQSLQVQATTDAATGLANRVVVQQHIEEVLHARRLDRGRCAVLFMDLDDFKLVNDSFGHEAGDRVLATVAGRLVGARLEGEVVARFGGDEFVVVIPQVDGADEAVRAAHRYLDAVTGIEQIAGQEFQVSTSIGVVVSRGHSATYGSVIRDADTAMYEAKRSAEGVVVFNRRLRARALEHLRIEQGLRAALRSGTGLGVCHQPIVDLRDGTTSGSEVLLRWVDPVEGRQQTLAAIEVAERSGLIHELGAWVLDRACRQWAAWHAAEGEGRPFSVNASAREVVRADYVAKVAATLRRHGVPPDQLSLELTERDVLHEIDVVGARMAELRAIGVRIAVDDFGTGYFSFAQLRQVPVDILKIDASFVRDMLEDPAADAIVRACIDLGRALGMEVVAEGVESRAQAQRVLAHGCRLAQGRWLGPPETSDLPVTSTPSDGGRGRDADVSPSAAPPARPGR